MSKQKTASKRYQFQMIAPYSLKECDELLQKPTIQGSEFLSRALVLPQPYPITTYEFTIEQGTTQIKGVLHPIDEMHVMIRFNIVQKWFKHELVLWLSIWIAYGFLLPRELILYVNFASTIGASTLLAVILRKCKLKKLFNRRWCNY